MYYFYDTIMKYSNNTKKGYISLKISWFSRTLNIFVFDSEGTGLSDMSEEEFAEKADLIVQIMQIGETITPNGTPLITAEEMQQGIMDVLDDNGDLSVVENIFKTYEEYETRITDLNNQLAAQQQQAEADE